MIFLELTVKIWYKIDISVRNIVVLEIKKLLIFEIFYFLLLLLQYYIIWEKRIQFHPKYYETKKVKKIPSESGKSIQYSLLFKQWLVVRAKNEGISLLLSL
jgi:hypothetical protein